MSMLDVLKTLSGTSVPNVLMGLGAVLVLLAFVEKIGTHIELPAKRQRLAAFVGVLLLTAGIGVTALPHLPGNGSQASGADLAANPRAPGRSSEPERETAAREPKAPAAGPSQTRSQGETPSIYAGSLGTLMPELSNIPASLKLSSKSSVDSTSYEVDHFKDPSRAREIVRNSELSGIAHTYAAKTDFCGLSENDDIFGAEFIVRRLKDAEMARELWEIGWVEASSSLGERYWKDGELDLWSGKYSVNVCYNTIPSILHQYGARAGNVYVTAGLYTPVRSQNSEWVEELSNALLDSMLAKVKQN